MKTILELCQAYKAKGYYQLPSGLIGIRKNRMYLWFQWNGNQYEQSGSTLTKAGLAKGASYSKL